MANNFKKVIDRQMWVLTSPTPNAHGAGNSISSDLRSDVSRNPFVYQLVSSAILNRYNIVTKSWNLVGSPVLGGTFGIGSTTVFTPSKGINGIINSGSSITTINTSTIITAIGVNMLANRGGSGEYGFKIRIIGLSSGKTEERFIVANSGGTTPTFVLDTPLTFTPVIGDLYEILSGSLYMLNGGVIAATSFKFFEIATNVFSNGGTANLPTPGIDSNMIALDEQYTPFDCEPGEGFIKGSFLYDTNITQRYAIVATATSVNSLTGQAIGGDASVLINEYRNFQIRIVQDTVTPTAVGQRRIIASHTEGSSPVYSLGSNWTVTPSTNAKYVIEYPNIIILRTAGNTITYTYNYNENTINNGTNSINNNTWSTTYIGVAPATHSTGCMLMPSYGIRPEPQKYSRNSFIYFIRGGNVNTMDLLDISGGVTGLWTANIIYDGVANFSAGNCGSYAPNQNEGRFFYINNFISSATNQIFRFDVKNRVLSPYTPTDWIQTGTVAVGDRLTTFTAFDGNDKYDILFLLSHASAITQELIVQI